MAVKHHLLAGAAATATALAAQAQTAPAPTLPEVSVQAGRLELRAFDTPGSVHVVDEAAIRAAGPQVNLSEALAGVPGVVLLNCKSVAEDL